MSRQSPSRNQRSKGIKTKHVLQICLLLAVCFWLIYQVKHSHDKKKEFDESSAKVSLGMESSESLIRLGRKDIQQQMKETIGRGESRDGIGEEEEETIGEDLEEIKHEEGGREDGKAEVKENDRMEVEDDETDEQELEKVDDRGEDLVDEERTDGDENENENEDKELEDGDNRAENEITDEETDREGDDSSTHEAREEHYKGDDASSAVTHDTRIVNIENEAEHEANSSVQNEDITEPGLKEKDNEDITEPGLKEKDKEDIMEPGLKEKDEENITEPRLKEKDNEDITEPGLKENEETGEVEKRKELEEESGEVDKDLKRLNVTSNEVSEDKVANSKNETVIEEINHSSETSNSTIPTTKDGNLSSPNVTESESNSTDSQAISNPDSLTESQAISTEKSDNAEDNADGMSESDNNEIPQEIRQEPVKLTDPINSLEEKDVRTDLDTLPEIQTEGTDNEESASE